MPRVDWKLPMEGACRCGKVRIRVTAPPLLTSACHCTGCQRMTASAYSLTMAVPGSGFEVIEGETVIGGLHGPVAHHHFCDHCKTWMYTTAEGMPFVNVRPTMLDDCRAFVPFIEVYAAEGFEWAKTPAKHRFDGAPAYEAYEGLIAEFMAQG
ncbi:MAG: GFA family protein [bacterium]